MRLVMGVLVTVILVVFAGYGGYHFAVKTQRAEIARIATVNVERLVRVRKMLDPNGMTQAKDLIDVGIGQDLFYMESFDSDAMSDAAYVRQRSRSISMLKQEWLEKPPFAIEDQTKAYIDTICLQEKGCPSGEIRPRPQLEKEKVK